MGLVWTGVFTLILLDTEGQLYMQFITKMAKNSSFFISCSFFLKCMCMYHSVCMCTTQIQEPEVGNQIPWDWNYRGLWAAMQVLEIEPGSSIVASALNCWATLYSPLLVVLILSLWS